MAGRRTNVLWGLLPLIAALALLVNSLGLLPEGLQDLLNRSWPALLVVTGLAFLLRDRVPVSGLLSILVGMALVGGVTFYAYSSRATQQRSDQQFPIEQPIEDDVTLLAVNVNTLSTDVEIRAGTDPQMLTGEFIGSTESEIRMDFENRGDGTAEFTLTESQSNQFPMLEAVGRGTLRLTLPPEVAVALAFTGQDAQATFNLNDVSLERLSFTLQEGDALVTFPDYAPRSPNAQDEPGELAVLNGSIIVFVPGNVAARLELNRGGNNIRPEFDDAYILIDDGADGTLEKRNIEEDDIPLFYEITAPRGQIELQVISTDADENENG